MRAAKLIIVGIVQGVGFRPFIYRLARSTGVRGYVRNVGGSEVEVVVEGSEERVLNFIKQLRESAPPAARIEEINVSFIEPVGYSDFSILPSAKEAVKYSMITPDIGICDDCLKEILDPGDRRYRYPFNSCAWCGPRYSMMYNPPYDRHNTSMRYFPLCNDCLKEYSDPGNIRRFHAQGISCPRCGPRTYLTTRDGELVSSADPVREASKLINEGYVVAVKGLGGYHIAALASDDDVVLKLRSRKLRPQKPFAVMVLNEEVASRLCYVDEDALKVLKSPERPIVLLPKREDSPVSKYVSPGLDVEGIFLPYTGLHYLLLMDVKDKFAIMTSGNPRGKPMCTDEECAFKLLRDYVDYFLIHDRAIVNRVDDSVVRFTNGRLTIIRRGRGYAPAWLRLRFRVPKSVIAFGAELQSAGAVAFDDKVVLTQYIGDVDDYEVLGDLEKYLSLLINVYNISISNSYLVVDKHPKYASKVLAEYYLSKYGGELIEVQHHYAHALATAVDVGLDPREEFIAVVMDGVGYGDDGNIWGGEVLRVGCGGYLRVGHLEYIPIVGADQSIKYPSRMLVSYLHKMLGRDEDEVVKLINKLNLVNGFKYGISEVYAVLNQLRDPKLMTSSTGRFLDSISALLKLCFERTYEGEPAIKLEAAARGGRVIDWVDNVITVYGGSYVILTTKILELLLENIERPINDLAFTSQYLLGRALGEVVVRAVYGTRVDDVVLGGGAAVNSIIVRGIDDALGEVGLKTHLPSRIPPNDGGIAVGQVASTFRYLT